MFIFKPTILFSSISVVFFFVPQRLMGGAEGGMPVMNGTAGAHGAEDYQQWMESKVAQGKASPQFPRHGGDVYSNTLPVRKVAPAKNKATLSKDTGTGGKPIY